MMVPSRFTGTTALGASYGHSHQARPRHCASRFLLDGRHINFAVRDHAGLGDYDAYSPGVRAEHWLSIEIGPKHPPSRGGLGLLAWTVGMAVAALNAPEPRKWKSRLSHRRYERCSQSCHLSSPKIRPGRPPAVRTRYLANTSQIGRSSTRRGSSSQGRTRPGWRRNCPC